ncbi:glutamate--cysteine ligase [Catenovulum agarivorans DS-2]|uniref:Glutamate--cysteine ligase n=1 Tax=Catenovulum agarivorans DS-2 TaxID=1328313 RepID=W7Q9K8_9ALTE|nr:glutamate--cysteine ligase [Catenovulum agarivorans]EWH09514.1 glutamate--cysteine ligase [Catenovulum agarivorans DS-2]
MKLADSVELFFKQHGLDFANSLNRGIEKEALRITPTGRLSTQPHPTQLGSALTNPYITTDYAESLLEFITPVENNAQTSIEQLIDLHKFAYTHQGSELLWPMSMPCFVGCEADIQIAQYGSSNVGKMKTLYREGLKHRYGSYMQVISGVHFNFSFPDSFWQVLAQAEGQVLSQAYISAKYLALLRNVKRHLWLLAYLFGASPALCGSFLKDKKSAYPFETVGKGTYYLPYATALRLSDLGYTNKAQAALSIRYNDLQEYIHGLKQAIKMPSADFAHIAAGENGIYQQLNKNVLQIENEYYAPVRPKRVADSGEKPTDALLRGGVQYIELRALDIDPFSPAGVNIEQIRFLDLFLTWCVLSDSPEIHSCGEFLNAANLQQTLLYGRKPGVLLDNSGEKIALTDWAEQIMLELSQLAHDFDGGESGEYQAALNAQRNKLLDANLTPSGKIIAALTENNWDNATLGINIAEQFKQQATAQNYHQFSEAFLQQTSEQSVNKQRVLEQAPQAEFSEFLKDYFSK